VKVLRPRLGPIHNPINLQEVAPQLWISQTPNLVRAYHKDGNFSKPEVEDVTSQLKVWEQAHRKDIIQVVALINRIISITKSCGGTTAIRFNHLTDKLVIEKTEKKKMLPDDLYARWTEYQGIAPGTSQNDLLW
jgi:hypothetical protein